MTALAQHPYTQALAWALVHFLWQGALIGLAAFLLRRFGRLSASTGYATGVIALAAMLAAPAITFARLSSGPAPLQFQSGEQQTPASTANLAPPSSPTLPVDAAAATGPRASIAASTAILGVWCAGVTLLSLRLFGGWVVARRLARRAIRPVAPEIDALARRVAGRLCLERLVGVFESSAVTVPIMIGWMKPVVLLPAAALTGLSINQVEAVLAHELAHVRRHDYLVNLLQSVVETLLFYHPAVWWVSRRVRADREHCCDDITLGVCDRVVYATALTRLAAMTTVPRVALAATDGSLINRVRRILGQSVEGESGSGWIPVFVVVLIVGSILPAALTSARGVDQEIAPAPIAVETPRTKAVEVPAQVAARQPETASTEFLVPVSQQTQATTDDAQRRALEADARAREIQKELAALEEERRTLEFRKADTEGKARLAMLVAQMDALRKQYEQAKMRIEKGLMSPTDAAELESQIAALQQRMKVEQAQQEYLASDLVLKRREAELKLAAEDQDVERVALKRKLEALEQQQMGDTRLKDQAITDAQMEQKFERVRELYRKGLVSKQTLNEAMPELEVPAEGTVSDQARMLLDKAVDPAIADAALIDVLKQTAKLTDDRERALLLGNIGRLQSLNPEMVSLYVTAAKGIHSDEIRARVFAQPVKLRQVK